jgi:1-phosphofructokinase
MSIVTVTLNPAIDQTMVINDFAANTVNRVEGIQMDPGGKGVNVASFLADYGLAVSVTGFLGAKNPELFEQLFSQKKIADHFIRTPGYTRTNIKIMDPHSQQTTDINQAGQALSEQALTELEQVLLRLVASNNWFVLSGKLPPGVPLNFYARLIGLLKTYGKQVVLDTSDSALAEGLRAGPCIAKPNIDELRQLTGRELATLPEVETAARQLQATGIGLVVVSMGKDGALFVSDQQSFVAVPPHVDVKTTVGAGDAMVAGLVAAMSQGLALADCARLATAFALSAISQVGTHLADSETLNGYMRQVEIIGCCM